jgi:hypothetical protein
MAATVAVRSRLLRITPRYRVTLEESGLAQFDEVMATQGGRCLRVLSDRENWYLPGNRQTPSAAGPEAEAEWPLCNRRVVQQRKAAGTGHVAQQGRRAVRSTCLARLAVRPNFVLSCILNRCSSPTRY